MEEEKKVVETPVEETAAQPKLPQKPLHKNKTKKVVQKDVNVVMTDVVTVKARHVIDVIVETNQKNLKNVLFSSTELAKPLKVAVV